MRSVTLRQLSVFACVAKHLSFSRAAEELHLTQPAVSMQVHSLEDQAGSALFEQVGKKVFLTTAGEELLRHARLIAQQLREADEALAAIRGVRGGRLTIGVVSTAKYFAPRLLAVFRRTHPEVELRLGVHNRGVIVRQLADNEIDLAIMGSPPREFETISQIIAEHPLVIISAPEHPLVDRRALEPRDLADESFLIREQGSGTRTAMERFFGERGVHLSDTMEMGSNETIKQAVIANMGLAFVSLHTVALELAVGQLAVLDVAGLPLARRWYIINIQAKPLSPAAEAFRYFILERAEALLAEQFGKTVPVTA